MKKGKLENLDIYIPNDLFDSTCSEKQFNKTKLSCWLDAKGITENLWSITEDGIESKSVNGVKFILSSIGAGLSIPALNLGIAAIDIATSDFIFVVGDLTQSTAYLGIEPNQSRASFFGATVANIYSDKIQLGDANSNTLLTVENDTLELLTGVDFKADFPSYDDDTAAGLGGLATGKFYVTTGSGAAPLNVAGLLIQKQ